MPDHRPSLLQKVLCGSFSLAGIQQLTSLSLDQTSLSSDQPYNTLYQLVSASLSRRAADFHLPLTVLLEGGRGIGKLSRVAAVAQTLGLHLMEVMQSNFSPQDSNLNLLQANCYDVLGESAVQTEAILQTRFDNACACSPCILVLRHLNAFNQSSQNNGSQPGTVTDETFMRTRT